MALRTENGWYQVGAAECEWTTIPGTNVTLQIQKGWPLIVMRAYAADYHAYVEPLRDADSACWTPTNSVATSNHLSGTAMDLNWNSHPFRVDYAGYTPQMIATMREILAFYEDTMFWAQDWRSPKDAMHHQLGYGTYDNPKVADFIRRKIRGDGFSTFRRGDTAPVSDAAGVLARATGLPLTRASEILPTMAAGLHQAECTNPNRIAMFIAQTGHESDNFTRTEEYASGAAYEGRADLGNTQPGDGVRFKGRTWIQITGRHNVGEFSKWAHGKGLVPSPTYFVDRPVELQELKWAGVGAAWYWTVARGTRINEASDRRDLVTVTQLINGGQTGAPDRARRYERALALGDQLLALIATTEPLDPWEELLMSNTPLESISLYATPGEARRFTPAEMLQSVDGMTHRALVERDARLGDPDALTRIVRVARGEGKYRDQAAINHARAVLAEIETATPEILQNYLKGQTA